MMMYPLKKWKSWLVCLSLFVLSNILAIACTTQPRAITSKELSVGIPPWPGYAAHDVAMANGFFKAEGVTVKEFRFATQTDADTGFLAKKVDLNWSGIPNAIPQASHDSEIEFIFQSDYSNGADGILGRNIKTAADVKGKQVVRENNLVEELLLRRYLKTLGLSRQDVKTTDVTAADAATAFAAKKVDIVVTYEPWMSKAAKQGQGKVIFSSKDTNLIADGLVARQDLLKNRQSDLTAYLRAIDRAVKLIREQPEATAEAIAKGLGITAAEVPAQMGGVKLYDLEMNKAISFNKQQKEMNLYTSLEFASKTAAEMKLIPQSIDAGVLNDSAVNAS